MLDNALHKKRAVWLFVVTVMVIAMVVLGGLVRLTRSGLSITEWNIITGILPPIGQDAWEEEFAKYQQSPEYIKINYNMTLEEYEFIYYMEYLHRLLGRIVGLVFVLPVFWMLFRKTLKWRDSGPYVLIGLGFAFQGWLGWYMVASGLVDRPSVSHFRLTAHLVAALTLMGLTFWVALNNLFGNVKFRSGDRSMRRIVWTMLAAYFVQVSYGGFVAGLKAGHVSNTWPLMFGKLVPPGLLSTFETWYENFLSNPTTVHFIHRWFAFVVFGLAIWLWMYVRKHGANPLILKANYWLLGFVTLQIILGVSVVLFNVPISLASIHQTVAIGIFLSILFVGHRILEPDQA